ncbi:MAG: indole-3-glycerol phosphate synthase TrpC [Rikenellaceae bacterium]
MKDILTEIIANKRLEVARDKSRVALGELIAASRDLPAVRSMSRSLISSPSGIIAEFKRRSPSKGWINQDADASLIPASYAAAGAAALSILTDIDYFGGSLKDIEIARPMADVPILRKEFVVDEYQIYQARLVGADAILLIASALSREQCDQFVERACELGLEVLLELHSAEELDYIHPKVTMVGVNNRNLGTFHTDVANSFKMSEWLPSNVVKISESGISNPDTVSSLREAGYRGFLIGENFMRTENPGASLEEFIGLIK